MAKDIEKNKNINQKSNELYFVLNSISNGTWVNEKMNLLEILPRNGSRQIVST